MKKSILRNYAKLIVKKGVNVQKNQDVIINASVDTAYFVKYVVEEAYKAHARKVSVEWNFDDLTKLAYKYESIESLSTIPTWKKEKLQYRVDTLPAMIHILSDDPDGLSSINQEKLLQVKKATGPILMKYREEMDNKFQWTIIGIPSPAWAKKVFPNLSKAKAMDALWDAILKVTRVYGNPLLNWDEHNKNLSEKANKLNYLMIKSLHYKANNGTDFTIDIQNCMKFASGGEYTLSKVFYNPNMPTEECFTSPEKNSCNGTVYASKPLSVNGSVVTDFGFKFVNGKVVEVLAKNAKDKEILEKLVSTDEGAAYLGEVALVPFDSPVNQTNVLFFNTLYDENACCHLALGRAFNECIKDFDKLSDKEIETVNLNKSMIHVDFMIGTNDLSIVATTYDNKQVTIFKDGLWVI